MKHIPITPECLEHHLKNDTLRVSQFFLHIGGKKYIQARRPESDDDRVYICDSLALYNYNHPGESL